MGPAQLSTQCVDNCLIRENLGKTQHVAKVLLVKSTTVITLQLPRESDNNSVAVACARSTQYFGLNTPPDLVVEKGKFGVDGGGGPSQG